MKAKCLQTKQIDSNKAYLIKWKPSAFKQSYFLIHIELIESNESCVHSNKANWFKKSYWIKWEPNAFK